MKNSKPQKKLRILFDAGPLVNGNKTGVGRTTEGLVLALAGEFPDQVELVGHYFDFLGRKKHIAVPQAPNIRYRRTVFIPGKVFNMLRRLGVWIPFELLTKERGDFHLFPGFIGWPSLFGTPNAPFVHDITYIDYPQYVNGPAQFDLRTIMPRTVKRAAFIITNSESSKQGLERTYDLANKPILVEHIPAVNISVISKAEADQRVKDLGISQPYILCFGTIEPRKNLVGLLRAYTMLDPSIRDKYALVLGGGKGWHDTEILQTIEELRRANARVYQTGYVSDEDRAALYMNAALYVLPSFYEGFGMQILEAMSYDTPMLVSDIPVLREVAADAASYTGTAPEDIAAGITELINNETRKQQLVQAGSKRLKSFSWKKVAQEIFSQIQKNVI